MKRFGGKIGSFVSRAVSPRARNRFSEESDDYIDESPPSDFDWSAFFPDSDSEGEDVDPTTNDCLLEVVNRGLQQAQNVAAIFERRNSHEDSDEDSDEETDSGSDDEAEEELDFAGIRVNLSKLHTLTTPIRHGLFASFPAIGATINSCMAAVGVVESALSAVSTEGNQEQRKFVKNTVKALRALQSILGRN